MKYLIILAAILFASCRSNSSNISANNKKIEIEKTTKEDESLKAAKSEKELPFELIIKSDAEWKKELGEKAYYVLREEGTERSHTSKLLDEKREGTFICGGCSLDLFESDTKFKSGTGWPSFYQPINNVNITENTDYKIGYARTEVECTRCGGHLGHVFNDGPEPTGLRYCINGVALNFKPSNGE